MESLSLQGPSGDLLNLEKDLRKEMPDDGDQRVWSKQERDRSGLTAIRWVKNDMSNLGQGPM